MIPKKITGTYCVYLLHFDEKLGHSQHYVGICKSLRLHWRMLEHARGKGSKHTARYANAGIGFTLAATFPTDDPDLENRIKRIKHYHARCPVCKGGAENAIGLPAIAHYAATPAMAQDDVISFDRRAPALHSQPMKKGRTT